MRERWTSTGVAGPADPMTRNVLTRPMSLQPPRSNHEPDPAAILDANEASPQSIGDHPDQGFRKHIIFFLPKITRMGALKFPLSGFSSWTPHIISCYGLKS